MISRESRFSRTGHRGPPSYQRPVADPRLRGRRILPRGIYPLVETARLTRCAPSGRKLSWAAHSSLLSLAGAASGLGRTCDGASRRPNWARCRRASRRDPGPAIGRGSRGLRARRGTAGISPRTVRFATPEAQRSGRSVSLRRTQRQPIVKLTPQRRRSRHRVRFGHPAELRSLAQAYRPRI